MHGAVLETRSLPAGTNLKRTFIAAMLEWIDAGWQIGEFSSRTGVFFCTKGVERRQIDIAPGYPGTAQGDGVLQWPCTNCED